jgi:hypothetical protein
MNETKRMSIDEVLATVTEIAQDPNAGADRFRALKMLASATNTAVVLPEPLTAKEVTDRLSRMILAAGSNIAQVAYHRAFPTKRSWKITNKPELHIEDVPSEVLEEAEKVSSLKVLYRMFPEIKKPGTPKGYPAARGIAVQREWLKRAAIRLIVDRERAKAGALPEPEGMDALVARQQAARTPNTGEPPAEATGDGVPQGVPVAE